MVAANATKSANTHNIINGTFSTNGILQAYIVHVNWVRPMLTGEDGNSLTFENWSSSTHYDNPVLTQDSQATHNNKPVSQTQKLTPIPS